MTDQRSAGLNSTFLVCSEKLSSQRLGASHGSRGAYQYEAQTNLGLLTLMKNESTSTRAVCLSKRRCVSRVFKGTERLFPIIRCRLGSTVNGDGPTVVSTIMRIS